VQTWGGRVFAEIFILLYVAHLLADYAFQTDHQAANKARPGWTGWRPNLAHVTTHVLLAALALAGGAALLDELAPLGAGSIAVGLLWIGVTHGFIDRRWPVARWMALARQKGFAATGGARFVDQAAHVAALAVAAVAMAALS
jgi:hypothetical protein